MAGEGRQPPAQFQLAGGHQRIPGVAAVLAGNPADELELVTMLRTFRWLEVEIDPEVSGLAHDSSKIASTCTFPCDGRRVATSCLRCRPAILNQRIPVAGGHQVRGEHVPRGGRRAVSVPPPAPRCSAGWSAAVATGELPPEHASRAERVAARSAPRPPAATAVAAPAC